MDNIIEVKNLTVQYKGKFFFNKKKTVLSKISFVVPRGKIVVILGKNGSGKSTLLKSMVNSTENDFDRRGIREGEIIFDGTNVLGGKGTVGKYQDQISYSMQSDSCEYYERSETIRSILKRRAEDCTAISDVAEKVDKMLEYFNAHSLAKKKVRSLSGGELRLLSIMECLIKDDAKVYFIDEPYNDLDDDRARRVSNYLLDMHDARPDIAIVVVTHCKKIPNCNNEVIAYRIEDGVLEETSYSHVLCLGELKDNRYLLDGVTV